MGATTATPAFALTARAASPEHPAPPARERYVPHPPDSAPDPEPVAVPDPVPTAASEPVGRELPALRTATSDTYAQPDGSYVTQR